MKNSVYYIFACAAMIVAAVFFSRQIWFGQNPLTNDTTSLSLYQTGIQNNGKRSGKVESIAQNQTDIPLKIPLWFSISYFAENLSGPRVLALDPKGNVVVSLTGDWKVVVLLGPNGSGKASEKKILLSGLSDPHGLLFTSTGTQTKLYVAETDKLMRYDYDAETLTVSKSVKIWSLPGGGRHFTRTLLGLPDGNILVSIWSSCDVCIEKNNERATVLIMKPEGTDVRKYATGLRNSVFLRIHPKTNEIWATEMGRDNLGDNFPPDEVNILRNWNFYGWPYCYGQKIVDTSFNKTSQIMDLCAKSTASLVDIPAHSAPLGLAFVPENWSDTYRWNLLVAYHGSWNRSIPTGYKVVQMKFDENGRHIGTDDFITGWMSDGVIYGRPVDLLMTPKGILYISDDKKGVIYRVDPN